jgi:hypothetical protein
MRLVIIESPYAGRSPYADESPHGIERNVKYARACLRDSLLKGEAPLASHLLYTQEGVLRDEIPEERKIGIEAGLAWGRFASLTAVYVDHGVSDGMAYGIKNARDAGRKIVLRRLGWTQEWIA